ncbi:MAG: phage portal protein [Bacteroidales bacterium]|nr:phage portal protein [Bacteroidales bacterium]
MNYQLIIDYINRKYGKDIKKSVMYDHISEWRHWLEGDVRNFHEFHKKMDLNDNQNQVKIHRNKTNMLLKGSEDWASILLNEKTRIVIEDAASNEFVMGKDEISGVFGDNDFWRNANELVATSRWSGTGAFEVYVRKMNVAEKSARLVSGKGVGINFLSAEQIIPISYDNAVLHEAAFVSERMIDGEVVNLVSVHTLNEEGTYDIESFYLDEEGTYIEKEGYGQMVHTGSPVPWFSLIRKSGVNIFDYNSPFGVSIISGAEDVLKGLDCAFDNFITDFKLGRKMVLMSSSMFSTDEDGKMVAPQESEEQLFINAGDKILDGGMYQEYNPTLRVGENAAGVQKMLDLFSMRIGLGSKRYVLDGSQINPTTATQFIGERQEMIQNANKEMICIEKALKEVTRAILWIGKNVLGENVDPDSQITIIADDSYIIDADTERAQWLNDVQMGIRSKTEFRMHFYGESETEAKKHVTPSLDELLKGMQAGVVGQEEIRQYLFPSESLKKSKERIAEIKSENDAMQNEAFEKEMEQDSQKQIAQMNLSRGMAQQDVEDGDSLEPEEGTDVSNVPF